MGGGPTAVYFHILSTSAMKKLLFIGSLSLFLTPLAHAQFGIKGGLNVAELTGRSGETATYKAFYHVGAFYQANILGPLSIQPEVQYSVVGGNLKSAVTNYDTELHYFTVPVLAKLTLGPVFVEAGPQYGVLLSANQSGQVEIEPAVGGLGHLPHRHHHHAVFDERRKGRAGGLAVDDDLGIARRKRVTVAAAPAGPGLAAGGVARGGAVAQRQAQAGQQRLGRGHEHPASDFGRGRAGKIKRHPVHEHPHGGLGLGPGRSQQQNQKSNDFFHGQRWDGIGEPAGKSPVR